MLTLAFTVGAHLTRLRISREPILPVLLLQEHLADTTYTVLAGGALLNKMNEYVNSMNVTERALLGTQAMASNPLFSVQLGKAMGYRLRDLGSLAPSSYSRCDLGCIFTISELTFLHL